MSSSTQALGRERLQFLDALRGIAALAVVLEHGFAVCIPGYLDISIRYFDIGQFGVTLFLLVSGFIIPLTLERGGSNARFWVNRFFRLFPLYWATIGLFALYYWLWRPEDLYPKETWQWLANLTMLQEFLRAPHVTQVFWTLTLELLFYASCSMLYALGLFRWTGAIGWLGQAGLLLAGVAYPLLTNKRFPGGYAFLFVTMFVGTLFHRFTTHQVSRRQLVGFLALLAPVSLAVSFVTFALFTRTGYPLTFHCVWAVWLAAYLCFAVGLGRRASSVPAWLSYLGRISYSTYLVHTWLVVTLPPAWPAPFYLGALFGGTLVLASLTYRWIEQPFMDLGRRLLKKTAGPPSDGASGGLRTRPKRALLACSNDWNSPFQVGSHHIARGLVRAGYEVAFISDPISPLHLARGWTADLKRRWALNRSAGRLELGGRLWAYVPFAWVTPHKQPILRSETVHRSWHRWTWPNLAKVIAARGFDQVDLLYIDSVHQSFWLDLLNYEQAVYRVADYNPHFEKYTAATRVLEREMAQRVDLVVHPSQQLETYARELGARQTMFLANGVDYAHFAGTRQPRPAEYRAFAGPIAVYVGVIPDWFHFNWLRAAALAIPDMQFVLIGPDALARRGSGRCRTFTCLASGLTRRFPASCSMRRSD